MNINCDTNPGPVSLEVRARDALASYGFTLARVERIGSVLRVALPDGPALTSRLFAAGVALAEVGLAVQAHDQRAILATLPTVIGR